MSAMMWYLGVKAQDYIFPSPARQHLVSSVTLSIPALGFSNSRLSCVQLREDKRCSNVFLIGCQIFRNTHLLKPSVSGPSMPCSLPHLSQTLVSSPLAYLIDYSPVTLLSSFYCVLNSSVALISITFTGLLTTHTQCFS